MLHLAVQVLINKAECLHILLSTEIANTCIACKSNGKLKEMLAMYMNTRTSDMPASDLSTTITSYNAITPGDL